MGTGVTSVCGVSVGVNVKSGKMSIVLPSLSFVVCIPAGAYTLMSVCLCHMCSAAELDTRCAC